MIKNCLNKFNQNILPQILLKNFVSRIVAVILLFLFCSSCSDQGCIDADDFGEYESQTLEVLANPSEDDCKYDPSADLNDSGAQGPEVRACFIGGAGYSNKPSVTDESNVTVTSTGGGCLGFTGNNAAKNQGLCASGCVNSCLANRGAQTENQEPFWKSTDKKDSSRNFGITIRPGTKIMIRAVGLVNLGDKLNYPSSFLSPKDMSLSFKNNSWANRFFDVKNGQSLDVSFSGAWNNGTSDFGGGTRSALDERLYNGSRRAVVYVIPSNSSYDFDTTATSEQTGTRGAPLLPEPKAWTCEYSETGNSTQSDCKNSPTGYTDAGFTGANINSLASSTFPISSNFPSSTLGIYGGIIRWNSDGFQNGSYDPFAGILCDTLPCSNISSLSREKGMILGEPTTSLNIEISNNYANAYKVSFKSLLSSSSSDSSACNVNLSMSIQDENGDVVASYLGADTVSVLRSTWSTNDISLEAGHKLIITPTTATYGSANNNCGRAIGIRFGKYYDIPIARSGFIKFTTLAPSITPASPNCSLKGRIINPEGSHVATTTLAADFYEYDSANDPLNSVSVPSSNYNSSATSAWSSQIFVRKGQVIRFAPESWDGIWTSGTISRQCGIGMAMYISPRPALLCRGSAPDKVLNPLCSPDTYNCNPATTTCSTTITNGTLVGCQANAPECYDTTDSTYYCPSPACQKTVNCLTSALGTAANNYRKSCTLSATASDASHCNYPSSLAYTSATCNSCSNKMLENSNREALLDKNLDQCYDLESYRGKVSNIPLATGFTAAQLEDSSIAKGAKKIKPFNGVYGNLEGFSDSGNVDIVGSLQNKIYKLRSPLVFSQAGRLQFLILDGSDFNATSMTNAYSDNSDNGTVYNGANGLKIDLAGLLSFTNGEWLETKLCLESSDTSTDCRSGSVVQLSGQPGITIISDTSTSTPIITSPYKYDNVGNLIRKDGGLVTGDCGPNQGITTIVPNAFYCHTYRYISAADLKVSTQEVKTQNASDISKLRISFKIRDPEQSNCTIPTLTTPPFNCHVAGSSGSSNNGYSSAGSCLTTPPSNGIKMRNPAFIPNNCHVAGTPGTDMNGYTSSNSSCRSTVDKNCRTPGSDESNGWISISEGTSSCSTTAPTFNCNISGGSTPLNGYSSTTPTCVSNTGNLGQICGIKGSGTSAVIEVPSAIASDATRCSKEFYCASRYSNNSGKYNVSIKTENTPGSSISNVISGVINPVVEIMDGTPLNCNKADPSSLDRFRFNGSKFKNPHYVKNPANTNGICSEAEAESSSSPCNKEFICKNKTVGQAERMYKAVIADYRYKAIVMMCFIVMITFYSVGYLMGILELTHTELINRVLKIAIISLFIGETGWNWFHAIVVNFFKNGADYLSFMMASSFDNSPEIGNAIHTGNYYDKALLFSSVDKVFGMFFAQAVQKKISALLFASIFGWVYLWIIYASFMLYVYAVANAVLLYLTAQVFISILFTLGPVFFIFTLFTQTKDMFDNWLKALIGFALQQIFLLTTLAFFNMLMYEVIKMSLGYKVCWEPVWTINILIRITLMSFWTIASLPPRTNVQTDVGNIGNPDGIPSIFSILFIWVIASLMGKFVGFMTDLATTMAGGLKASAMGAGVKSALGDAKKFMASKAQERWKKTGGLLVDKMDEALFDSGELAEKNRKDRKMKNSIDANHKSAMGKSAKDAVKDYKKNNAAEFAGMNKEEQDKKLASVRMDAMMKKGTEMGLSEAECKRLISDKGVKDEDHNLLKKGAKALYQAVKPNGTLTTSLGEKKADNTFSRSSLKESIKTGSKEEQDKIIAAAKSGNIKVGTSNVEKAKNIIKGKPIVSAAKAIARGIKSAAKTVHDETYDQARDELVANGTIDAHRAGTNWSRSDGEKKQIREKQREIIARKEAALSKNTNSANAVAFLEQAQEDVQTQEVVAAAVESGTRPTDLIHKDTMAGKALRAVASYVGKKSKESRIEKGKEMKEAGLEKVNQDFSAAIATHRSLESAEEAELKVISDIDSDRDFADQNTKLTSLELQGKTPSNNREARAIVNDPAYKEKSARRKAATASVNNTRAKKKDSAVRINKLKRIKDQGDIGRNIEDLQNKKTDHFNSRRELNPIERSLAKRGIAVSGKAKAAIEDWKVKDSKGVEVNGFDAIKEQKSKLKEARSADVNRPLEKFEEPKAPNPTAPQPAAPDADAPQPTVAQTGTDTSQQQAPTTANPTTQQPQPQPEAQPQAQPAQQPTTDATAPTPRAVTPPPPLPPRPPRPPSNPTE